MNGWITRRRLLKGALLLAAGLPAAGTPPSIPTASGQQTVWLNVHVETRTTAAAQQSWASAWTSSDREGRRRVPVGKIHLMLEAHGRQEKECATCDYLRVDESHDGPSVVKARARAWAEGPDISPVDAST